MHGVSKTAIYKSILTNKLFYKVLINYLFSHHPECEEYSSHTWKIGSVNFCKSCTGSFILLNTGIVFFLIFPGSSHFFTDASTDLLLLLLMTPVVILYLIGVDNERLRSISRVFFLLFVMILMASFIFVESIIAKLFFLIWMLIGLILVYRRRKTKMIRICEKCRYNDMINLCPGYQSIQDLVNAINQSS
jgi:hypothetical protein